MEYNPFARDIQTNPYPAYQWLRDEAPVYHNSKIGFHALSRFDDVMRAHLDTATYRSSHGAAAVIGTIHPHGRGAQLPRARRNRATEISG